MELTVTLISCCVWMILFKKFLCHINHFFLLYADIFSKNFFVSLELFQLLLL